MNNIFRLLFFCLITGSGLVHGQPAGYKIMGDNKVFKQQFSDAAKKLNTIQSDFVQEKNLAMLSEKITSSGKFWFKKDNLVRMEYTSPFRYLMIINKNNVFIKDDQKENKISARSNKMFQQINRIIVDCVQGTALDNKDFSVKTLEGKDGYLIYLSPIAKAMKELFNNINVVVDKKDYSILRMEMVEAGGDNTIIRFTNKQLNIPVSDALFAVK
ncbi:MAG: outer membrane lipoprotein carrier protein LolA [Chitinophagaceae bacterium]|nr:MAG: outer membrane lipoprotein carrier protein LolA [Chitinophagaceae bacterium]